MSRFAAQSGKAHPAASFGMWALSSVDPEFDTDTERSRFAKLGAALLRALIERHSLNLEASRAIGWSPTTTTPADADEEGAPGEEVPSH